MSTWIPIEEFKLGTVYGRVVAKYIVDRGLCTYVWSTSNEKEDYDYRLNNVTHFMILPNSPITDY
jgi:hypothetical protein